MQASFRKGNDLGEKFICLSRFFLVQKKPDTTTLTGPIPLVEETLVSNDPSFTSTKHGVCAAILYILYLISITFLLPREPVKYYITLGCETKSWWPCDLWSANARIQKRRRCLLFSDEKERETARQDVPTKFFHSVFRFKRHDCGNNGRESTNHAINRPFHVSGRAIDEPCAPAALTFSEDKASMRKREKETISACAHVCKKDKESKRGDEETTQVREAIQIWSNG